MTGPANVASARPRSRRRRNWLFVTLCVVGLAALAVSLVLPSREEKLARLAHRACPHTLMVIGMLAQMYQNDNGGLVPPDLDTLQRYAQKDHGGDTWRRFTCPYAHERGVPPAQQGAVCMSHYVYVVPPGVTHGSQVSQPGETVCAYEPLENHDGLGSPILFWDGHSTWYDAPEAARIIAEVKAGHNPPRAGRK